MASKSNATAAWRAIERPPFGRSGHLLASIMSSTALGTWQPRPAWSRCLPFALFIVLMAGEPWLAPWLGLSDTRWCYGLRSAAAAALLLWFWPRFDELLACRRLALWDGLLAVATGGTVLAVWLLLDSGIFILGTGGSGFVPLREDGTLHWPLALLRLAGSALVVPLIEELFWRSFLMRWLEREAWASLEPAAVGLRALFLSSLVFGLEHQQWAAGLFAGLAYGWLYRRSGSLWPAILAHAVTNAGLGAWVLLTGAWHFW